MSSRTAVLNLAAALAVAGCASAGPARVAHADAGGGLQAGLSAYNAGNYAQAEALLNGQSGAEANAYLAAARVKQRKLAEAEGPANAALAEAPAHPVAAAALGDALVNLGRLDDAVERMGAVLAADNNVAYAHYWRGQAYYKKREAGRMTADFEAFLRLAPDAPEAGAVRQLMAALR